MTIEYYQRINDKELQTKIAEYERNFLESKLEDIRRNRIPRLSTVNLGFGYQVIETRYLWIEEELYNSRYDRLSKWQKFLLFLRGNRACLYI